MNQKPTFMVQYSLFVLKVQLNPNNQTHLETDIRIIRLTLHSSSETVTQHYIV